MSEVMYLAQKPAAWLAKHCTEGPMHSRAVSIYSSDVKRHSSVGVCIILQNSSSAGQDRCEQSLPRGRRDDSPCTPGNEVVLQVNKAFTRGMLSIQK